MCFVKSLTLIPHANPPVLGLQGAAGRPLSSSGPGRQGAAESTLRSGHV